MKSKLVNTDYVLKSGVEFRAPKCVVDKIYKSGKFITTGNCRHHLQVCKFNREGKVVYLGSLSDYVKPRGKCKCVRYKDGNHMNVTYRNILVD